MNLSAVINFNRLPELPIAACRRLGKCTMLHFLSTLASRFLLLLLLLVLLLLLLLPSNTYYI